jgi:hypothetical protein
MALKTITYLACDGCGTDLRDAHSGVVIHGYAASIEEKGTAAKVLLGSSVHSDTAVVHLCWKCLGEKLGVPKPEPRIEYRDREPRIVYRDRPQYEETYTEPYKRPGHGPTGPLPPPDLDLEHVARVMKGLCR